MYISKNNYEKRFFFIRDMDVSNLLNMPQRTALLKVQAFIIASINAV